MKYIQLKQQHFHTSQPCSSKHPSEACKPASCCNLASQTSNKPNQTTNPTFRCFLFSAVGLFFWQRIKLLCYFLHLELHYGELMCWFWSSRNKSESCRLHTFTYTVLVAAALSQNNPTKSRWLTTDHKHWNKHQPLKTHPNLRSKMETLQHRMLLLQMIRLQSPTKWLCLHKLPFNFCNFKSQTIQLLNIL